MFPSNGYTKYNIGYLRLSNTQQMVKKKFSIKIHKTQKSPNKLRIKFIEKSTKIYYIGLKECIRHLSIISIILFY